MKTVTQSIVRLSILCYLVMASIAAAHALPMPNAEAGKGAVMVMDMASGDETATSDEMEPDCHQSKPGSLEVSSMSLCKIFCSVTAHAVTSDILVDLASIAPPVHIAFVDDNFQTRQLVVEQHPPK